MEERGETPVLAGFGSGEVPHPLVGEEHRQETAGTRNLMDDSGLRQGAGEQSGQPVGVGVEGGVHRIVGVAQCGQAGGHGHRVTRQGAGLIDRPQRGKSFHHVAASAERGRGQSTAHHLAEGEQVGLNRIDSVPTGSTDPETGHHLVEDQQRAALRGDPAERGVEAADRRDGPHVARSGLGDDGRDRIPELGERRRDRVNVVVGQHDRVGGRRPGDTGRRGQAESGHSRSRIGEQGVDVSVVAPGELHDLGPAGEPASQPHRAHGGLGAGVDQTHPLHRGHPGDDLGGQVGLAGRGRAERQAPGRSTADRVHDRWMGMPEDHRTPRAHQVDVAVPVGVGQPAALRGGDVARRSADGIEGANR